MGIFKIWCNIGFILFTQQALNHPKVCNMLSGGGAGLENKVRTEKTLDAYKKPQKGAKKLHLNRCVFT